MVKSLAARRCKSRLVLMKSATLVCRPEWGLIIQHSRVVSHSEARTLGASWAQRARERSRDLMGCERADGVWRGGEVTAPRMHLCIQQTCSGRGR